MNAKPLHLELCDVLTAHGLRTSLVVDSSKIRIVFQGGSIELNVASPVVFEKPSEGKNNFPPMRPLGSFENSKYYKKEMKHLRKLYVQYCEKIAADRDISVPPQKSMVGFPRVDFLSFWHDLNDTQKREYLAKYDIDVSREAYARISREFQGVVNGIFE